MRAILLTVVSAAGALALSACASAPPGGGAGGGEALYRERCASCHRLHDPAERTRAGWNWIVERMAPRAHLSGEERAAVLRYLHAHAKDAAAPRGSR